MNCNIVKENPKEPIEKRQFLSVGERVVGPDSISYSMMGDKWHNYPYAAKKGAAKRWRG